MPNKSSSMDAQERPGPHTVTMNPPFDNLSEAGGTWSPQSYYSASATVDVWDICTEWYQQWMKRSRSEQQSRTGLFYKGNKCKLLAWHPANKPRLYPQTKQQLNKSETHRSERLFLFTTSQLLDITDVSELTSRLYSGRVSYGPTHVLRDHFKQLLRTRDCWVNRNVCQPRSIWKSWSRMWAAVVKSNSCEKNVHYDHCHLLQTEKEGKMFSTVKKKRREERKKLF